MYFGNGQLWNRCSLGPCFILLYLFYIFADHMVRRYKHKIKQAPKELRFRSQATNSYFNISIGKVTSFINQMQATSFNNQVQATSFISQIQATSFINQVQATSFINQVQATSFINQVQATSLINQVQATSFINQVQAASCINQVQATSCINQVFLVFILLLKNC